MRIIIEEIRHDHETGRRTRPIAEWSLPTTIEPLELSFTQLATPDTTKVCTYRLVIVQ